MGIAGSVDEACYQPLHYMRRNSYNSLHSYGGGAIEMHPGCR